MRGEGLVYTVSDFVAVCNQVLDVSFGSVQITGELSQFRISKNRWAYFDLKDDFSSVRFFGTVYQLPGPLEDGMLLTVRGIPQLHPKFGFSITVQTLQLAGEGTIKKAANLLEAKLDKEGLFLAERKRDLPHPPTSIGLITSGESAAYADFVKVLNHRWGGIKIVHYDVQVQGEQAPGQIIEAINHFNTLAIVPDVLVVIRGGGSADDLQAFSTESVTRAVAGSRIPTMVAIGHEIDTALAERAADVRASTPSNAAELLTPDRKHEQQKVRVASDQLNLLMAGRAHDERSWLDEQALVLERYTMERFQDATKQLMHVHDLLKLLSPEAILRRGFSIVRQEGRAISKIKDLKPEAFEIQFHDGKVRARSEEKGLQ